MNIEIPRDFAARALEAVDAGMRSPLHPPTDQDIRDIAYSMVNAECQDIAVDVVELLARCICAVVKERADARISGDRLHLIEE